MAPPKAPTIDELRSILPPSRVLPALKELRARAISPSNEEVPATHRTPIMTEPEAPIESQTPALPQAVFDLLPRGVFDLNLAILIGITIAPPFRWPGTERADIPLFVRAGDQTPVFHVICEPPLLLTAEELVEAGTPLIVVGSIVHGHSHPMPPARPDRPRSRRGAPAGPLRSADVYIHATSITTVYLANQTGSAPFWNWLSAYRNRPPLAPPTRRS